MLSKVFEFLFLLVSCSNPEAICKSLFIKVMPKLLPVLWRKWLPNFTRLHSLKATCCYNSDNEINRLRQRHLIYRGPDRVQLALHQVRPPSYSTERYNWTSAVLFWVKCNGRKFHQFWESECEISLQDSEWVPVFKIFRSCALKQVVPSFNGLQTVRVSIVCLHLKTEANPAFETADTILFPAHLTLYDFDRTN